MRCRDGGDETADEKRQLPLVRDGSPLEEEEDRGIDQGVMMEIESGLWDRVIFKLNDQVRLVETNYDVLKIQKAIIYVI
jgi:hypothetical protein